MLPTPAAKQRQHDIVDYLTRDGIAIIEGLEAVRRRPGMYIGPEEPGRSLRSRLLEVVVGNIAKDSPKPREIRVALWRDGAMTVAYDGDPIPIEPFSRSVNGIAHPHFYEFFLYLHPGGVPTPLAFGAVLNALSERLVVSTMHGGNRYRAVFSRGMVVTLLARCSCETPLGTTWFTFYPDDGIITGPPLNEDDARAAVERLTVQLGGVPIVIHDRSTETADWF
jgi:DNA gyrase subunit B